MHVQVPLHIANFLLVMQLLSKVEQTLQSIESFDTVQ